METCKRRGCSEPSTKVRLCAVHYAQQKQWISEWRRRNPERVNANRRRLYAADPEKHRAKQLADYYKHRERRIAQTYAAFKKRVASMSDEERREFLRERSRKAREKFRTYVAEQVSRSRVRARKLGREGALTTDEAMAVLEKQDFRCYDCGAEGRLTLGHAVPLFHKFSRNDAANLIFQCNSCNCKQHNGIHPHFEAAYWARVKEHL